MLSFECIKNEKSVYFLLTSAKTTKKSCNKLFTSALERLVGQRRLVQIYLPGRGGTELSCQHFRRGDR